MLRLPKFLTLLVVMALIIVACGGETPTEAPLEEPTEPAVEEPVEEPTEEPVAEEPTEEPMEEEPTEEPMEEEEPTEEPMEEEAAAGEVVFFSTQFDPIEEQEVFRAILQEGGYDVTTSTEGPLLDTILASVQAGEGEIDVVGALHGTFPPLQREDALMNMIDVYDDLSADREFAQSFVNTGLLGTEDFLYYVPWLQATYIMAAHTDALEYLPEGVELETMTWEQFAEWCQVMLDETGSPKCGLPHAGLFHRFLEGYLWPSYTGGMVSEFRSDSAAEMLAWARDSLWPTIHPQSISYEFMQEPLLAGEVWVAFDHTARLIDAFNEEPETFVAFPAPSGPVGKGFMPVIVGLGMPVTAPNPEGGGELIDFLTQPDTQARILRDLAFFPVVSDVDTGDLPEGVTIELDAVTAQANAGDAIPALLPVGLGDRGGELDQTFRNAFDRVVIDGEDINTVLAEEGDSMQALLDETGAPCWAPDPLGDGPCQVNE
ncbi:MAG: ABC transporter substrate-binding protein [Chloroflexota bacterium]